MPNSNPLIPSPPFLFNILFVFLAAFFIIGIVYFLLKTDWLKRFFLKDLIEFLTSKPFEMRGVSREWQKIVDRLRKGLESEAKLAVIEADDLLKKILGKIGYEGETLGEKLKKVNKATLPNLDEVLEAHRIRSNITHDPSYRLTLDKAGEVLAAYKRALLELEVL